MRTFSFALALTGAVAACSRGEATRPPPDAASEVGSAKVVVVPSASASPYIAVITEGPHDYRGMLGQRTKIAARLVRSGPAVSGFYVYVGVGAPIPLTGTVDAAGTLLLTETTAGKPTGTVTLRPSRGDLDGDWKNAGGDKRFPIRLSPGPRWVTPGADAGTADVRAEACLADPRCAAAEADRLFVVADDARAPGLDCFRFVEGVGTRKDVRRGRACLERSVGTSKCEGGSSNGLLQADLAIMLIDGQGGAVDVPRARALFAGCLEDFTTMHIVEHAEAKERNPNTAPVSFCKDIGGTTLTMNDCFAEGRTTERTRVQLEAKRVAADLTEAQVRLFIDAGKAYEAYVSAMGEFAYEVYIEGSIRNVVSLAREQVLYRRRAKALGELTHFVAPEAPSTDLAQAEAQEKAALAAVTTSTPAEKAALQKTEVAWIAYREAEVRFYAQVFGTKQGLERVERAVRATLAAKRAGECASPSPSGE